MARAQARSLILRSDTCAAGSGISGLKNVSSALIRFGFFVPFIPAKNLLFVVARPYFMRIAQTEVVRKAAGGERSFLDDIKKVDVFTFVPKSLSELCADGHI